MIDEDLREQCYEFLEDLRDSGIMNMYGAGPVLAEEFGIDKSEARVILRDWMDSVKQRRRDKDNQVIGIYKD